MKKIGDCFTIEQDALKMTKLLRRNLTWNLVFVCMLLSGRCICAAEPSLTEAPVSEINVHRFKPVVEGGMYVDWSPKTDLILLDKQGVDRYYNIYTIRPDGLNLKSVSLSKQRGEPRQHNGNASWSPDGNYFVFIAQNPGTSSYRASMPGIGLNCNVWIGKADGSRFWQLTKISTSYTAPKGVASPYLSPDGKVLFWSGRTGKTPAGLAWGEHALYLADFDINDGNPKLSNIRTIQPGDQKEFYESHGFSPDGNQILFSGNLEKNTSLVGMDIYVADREKGAVKNLTNSPRAWDRHAAFSPDGRKIVWMSTAGQDIPYMPLAEGRWERYLKAELWLMNADGSEPKQLTFFNTLGRSEYVGRRCFVGDSTWSRDGRQIAVTLHVEALNFNVESRVVILELGIGPRPEDRAAGREAPPLVETPEKKLPKEEKTEPKLTW